MDLKEFEEDIYDEDENKEDDDHGI